MPLARPPPCHTFAVSENFELEIGFDTTVSGVEATHAATARWRQAVQRAGKEPVGALMLRIPTSEGLERIGQFSVIVSGEVVDAGGDQ